MTKITLTVTSDIVCAFCYVGYRELAIAIDTAKKAHPAVEFAIEYRPFLLMPGLNCKEPVSRATYLTQKFGEQRFGQIMANSNARGKEVGINFKWDGKMRQSMSAHRILMYAYAKEPKLQIALLDKLFFAAYEEEKDVGEHEVLATLTEEAGVMTKAEAFEFLASGKLLKEVQQAMMEAKKTGVTGVPFVVINQKFAIAGAEKSAVYLDAFEKLITRGDIST